MLKEEITRRQGKTSHALQNYTISSFRWSEFPECIIIPMRDETELNVWFEKTNEEDKVYCNTKYIVKIKVQNSGYAQVHGSF